MEMHNLSFTYVRAMRAFEGKEDPHDAVMIQTSSRGYYLHPDDARRLIRDVERALDFLAETQEEGNGFRNQD